VKHAICTWVPLLNFGWLKPEYKDVVAQLTYTESNSYANVMPVQTTADRIVFTEVGPVELDPIHPLDWLAGTPATREEVSEWRREIRRRRCSDRFAMYTAYSQMGT
jgi:hypothetical protein